MSRLSLVAITASLLLLQGAGSVASAAGQVQIKVLSNRADLMSGGDALVEIVLPAGVQASSMRMDVDGRDVTSSFSVRLDGRFIGLLTGLQNGPNVLRALKPDGSGARITITNHPIGGPVFSGPQVQPWTCTTSSNGLGNPTDSQCNAPSTMTTVVLPTGLAVGYERGTLNRGIYDIAIPPNWNHKLLYIFGAGTGQHYDQGTPDMALDQEALGKGFAVAASSMTNNGQHSNDVTAAETVIMIKEHIVERYGEILYTIGQGGSGGALLQNLVASNYPGLLDGLRPGANQDWQDTWTGAYREFVDCALIVRYFNAHSGFFSTAQQLATEGHQGGSGVCSTSAGRNPDYIQPNDGTSCAGSASYNASTNPTGVRCTLQDFMVSIFGVRPEGCAGAGVPCARRAIDNVGVQYGLAALQAHTITPDQFVDLNENAGGYDINGVWQAQRSEADLDAVRTAYRSGRVTNGRELAKVPIVVVRSTNNNDYHYPWRTYVTRARLDRDTGGHHENQVVWTSPPPNLSTLDLVDRWLTAVRADTSSDPLEVKVRRDRPADGFDACWINNVQTTNQAACDAQYPYDRDTRVAAGEGPTSDILKCQLKPLDRADYPPTLTDALWARLQATFPTGVCDWSRPGVEQQPPLPWMTFAGGPGGEPLGPPPESTPIVPTAVTVSSFTAARAGKGVVVRWRTATETNVLGFNLYRRHARSWVKLNKALVAAAGTSAGRGYSFRDRAASGKHTRYRLEVVGLDGHRLRLTLTT